MIQGARIAASSHRARQDFDARYRRQGPIYVGTLLNVPHELTSVRQGDLLRFLVVPGLPHPLHVTTDYLRERPFWGVVPCNQCGAS